MKIDMTTLSRKIAAEVVKMSLPHLRKTIRKIVKEEIENSVKDVIYEVYKEKVTTPKQKPKSRMSEIIDGDFDDEYEDNEETPDKSAIKNTVNEARNKVKESLGNYYASNGYEEVSEINSIDDLIMSAKDPQEEAILAQEAKINKPLTDSSKIDGEWVDPDAIDFSAHVKDLD